MATVSAVGQIKEFDPNEECIAAYLERFDLYLAVNKIDEAVQASTFLLVVGRQHYSLLRDLVAPDKPEKKSLETLKGLLLKHYEPEPIVIAERFHFYQRNQKPGESIADYHACLRKLASRCQFGEFLSQALRDKLVCGLLSESIQKALLAKADLTLDKAVETAQGMEAAAQRAKELKGSQRSSPVLKVDSKSANCVGKAPGAGPCGRCGRGNHSSSECKFKSAKCHKCGRVGHIASVCRSKPRKPQSKSAQWVAASEPALTESQVSEPLFVVEDQSSHPYQVELQVNGCPLTMEVDTGAGVSIAPESVLSSLQPSVSLQPSNVVLKTYTGQCIPVKGVASVDVTYNQKHFQNLNLLIVEGSGPSLLGRDWLRVIRLDWKRIGRVSAARGSPESQITALQGKFQEVFSDTLGTITPFKAKLSVKEDARPKFFKPRSVPYALRDKVEYELDHLERNGVLERTTYSEWAAPIVAVPKRDGRLRLCGDYKVTVNPSLDVEQYPRPKPEDIFASLSGGEKFTTLDLAQAYNQLLLDEESRRYVTINTRIVFNEELLT